MAIEITVPRLGWSMEEGIFVEWRKADGDRIRPGDILYVLESEKSAEEIESLDEGILRIPADAAKPGEKVLVGQVLAFLVTEGEAAPSLLSPPPRAKVPPQAQGKAALVAPSAARSERIISPRARRIASEIGIDWTGLTGSGRTGRIRERDIRTAAIGQSDGRLIPHTKLRRIIAARMVAGVTQAAPVTLTTKADATELVELRKRFKSDTLAPSYTDLILKLAAIALRQHPLLQAQWREDGLFVPNRIDIAFAVDSEAGLLAPVVRGADKLTVQQIATQSRELTTLARAGRLTANQMRDATFTISNLGSFGIDAFTPIIHLPQCAVLGVGCIRREPTVIDNKIVLRDRITLSLTFDHRIVDGAPAARFLATLRVLIDQSESLMADS